MKRRAYEFVIAAVMFTALVVGCIAALYQPKPTKLSGEDREKLKRIAAQIQVLELQAQPLGIERNEIYTRNCKAAGVALQVCRIDPETGDITAQKPPETAKK